MIGLIIIYQNKGGIFMLVSRKSHNSIKELIDENNGCKITHEIKYMRELSSLILIFLFVPYVSDNFFGFSHYSISWCYFSYRWNHTF